MHRIKGENSLTSRKAAQGKRLTGFRRFLIRNRGFILFVFCMAIFRSAVADWNYVPSGSMEPTIFGGDYLWVNKTAFGPSIPFTDSRVYKTGSPERGDIITFYPPHTEKQLVKRVIGVPGDTVEIQGNTVTVNGKQLGFSFDRVSNGVIIGRESIDERSHALQFISFEGAREFEFSTIVPEGNYFVLGDSRNNSIDSRFWGYVEEEHIMGKVTHVALSFSSKREWKDRFIKKLN